MKLNQVVEECQVMGHALVDKVRKLIHEGNVNRIIVKDENGQTYLEIPVTLATIGVVLAPLLAALGTLAAVVARFTVVVVRNTSPNDRRDSTIV